MSEQEYTESGMSTRDLGDVFVATQIEMWRRRIDADPTQLGTLVWELMQAEARAKKAEAQLERLTPLLETERSHQECQDALSDTMDSLS